MNLDSFRRNLNRRLRCNLNDSAAGAPESVPKFNTTIEKEMWFEDVLGVPCEKALEGIEEHTPSIGSADPQMVFKHLSALCED